MLIDVKNLRNNHLLDIIHEIQNSKDEYIDNELIYKLCQELKVGSFITPACEAGLMRMPGLKDNTSVIPMFTSLNEYNIGFSEDNIGVLSWNFNFFNELIEDFDDIEGIVVNPNEDNFFISFDIINNVIEMLPDFSLKKELKNDFTHEELLDIYEHGNPELNSFLDNYDGKNIEELIEQLSKNNLYTFIVTTENQFDLVNDGIILTENVETKGIFTVNYGNLESAYLFTDPKYFRKVKRFHEKNGWYVYALPTDLKLMCEYVLSLDLDYLFINPNDHEIILTRELLLEYVDLINEKCSENIEYDLGKYSFSLTKRNLRKVNRILLNNKGFKG